MLLLIGAGLCGWLLSSTLPTEANEIEPRKDWGQNGMGKDQCASYRQYNNTHGFCSDNHNI